MKKRLAFVISTAIVGSALTFAPLAAQDMPNTTVDNVAARDLDDNDGMDFGWLGLIGLLGLAGLMRRDRHDHPVTDRTTHR
jgi:MYXO-CTERM domain-containing protein